ncbi:MAG: VWA domain-containing protein [Chloroflexota bacterium]|nr:VWA domain-containing protein [Chloroflexota bacterium]MDE2947973.1 VWA domain-containing protein [Chloroflexota bacterium]
MQLTAPPVALLLFLFLPIVWAVGFPRHAFRRRRDLSSLILRTLIIVLLILALAGLQNVQAVDRLAVVFLVDASDSMGGGAEELQLEYIREAISAKQADDEWAALLFGDNAVPETDFSMAAEIEGFSSIPVTTGTDIANAIQTGLSLFPPDASRRMVILSDGQATQGNAVARAQRAAVSGVEISYVPFFREAAPDVRITALDAPGRVAEKQSFDISVSIHAESATPATLLIFSGGGLIHEESLNLQAGDTRFSLTQTSENSGFLDFSAQIVVPGENDNFSQNNQLGAFSQVVGPARVLLIRADESETAHLLPALAQAGLVVEVAAPGDLAVNMAGLAHYKCVILANVPATDLSGAQMSLLDQYVSDIGGGLVMIGGPESYAPGGYYQTPLERTLPVEMQIKDQRRLPQLTIAYLIDRSGSMGQIGRSGVPNLELAKRAIVLSLELLQPSDRVAIGTFDTGGAWVAPFQPVNDAGALIAMTNTIRSGGGTDILAGLRLVERDIIEEPSQIKHLILLTDGGASPTGLVELTERLHDVFNVSLSAIAIGRSPGPMLEPMAEAGGGNFYRVEDVEQIPLIFAQETVLASRSYIVEETFSPRVTGSSAIIDGIGETPPLRGYVATTPKIAAQRILSGPEPYSDPILASWQYGLGRVVAWTSDASARWANEWVPWEDFSRFWGQVVAWSVNAGASEHLETRVLLENDRARIVVDARDDDGEFLDGLHLTSALLNPAGDSVRIPLQQTAPGRYEATFEPKNEGAYFLTTSGEAQLGEGAASLTDLNGWVMSYSPEYIPRPDDDGALAEIADITGGRNLAERPADVFAHDLGERQAATDIWERLLLLALILLPLDIAIRRLIITRSDLLRLRAYLFGGGRDETRSQQMQALFSARGRGRAATQYGDRPTFRPRPPRPDRPPRAAPSGPALEKSTSGRDALEPEFKLEETVVVNLGDQLLRRRRRRDDEEEDDDGKA